METIIGSPPSKSNGYRIITIGGHGSLTKTASLKEYENAFYMQCSKYRNANIDDYFYFFAKIYFANQRPDLDGSLKVILDCLQKCNAIKNDNKCVKIHIGKFLDKKNPRIEFILKRIKEDMTEEELNFIKTI